MGQTASVRANQRVRKIGDAELAAIGRAFVVWSPIELRKLLDVFRELTNGTNVCSKRRFMSHFTCLYGLSPAVRERCFTFFDASRDGFVDFEEFVRGLTISQRGRPEERIRFLYDLYASDGKGLTFADVVRLVWDASGRCAQQGLWNELNTDSAREGGAKSTPTVYLTEDADIQSATMKSFQAKALELFQSKAFAALSKRTVPTPGTDTDSDNDSEDEDDDSSIAGSVENVRRALDGEFSMDESKEDGKTDEDDINTTALVQSTHHRLATASTTIVPRLPIPTHMTYTTTATASPTTGSRMAHAELCADFTEFSAWCMAGTFPYQDYLKRWNPIPTQYEEAGVIASLLQTTAPKGLVEGSTWCLITTRWWEMWLEYCGRGDEIEALLFQSRTPTSNFTGNSVIGSPRRAAVVTNTGEDYDASPSVRSIVSVADALMTVTNMRGSVLGTPPSRRLTTERASILGRFSNVLPEVGKALCDSTVFAGVEGTAGTGHRVSRVQRLSVSKQGIRHGSLLMPPSPLTVPNSAGSSPQPTSFTPPKRGTQSSIQTESLPGSANRLTPISDTKPTPTEALVVTPTIPGARVPRVLVKTMSFATAASRPGFIDNSELQSMGANGSDVVRRDAVEGEQYVLLPDVVWSQLVCWYGGNQTFPRQVVDFGTASAQYGGDIAVQHLEVDVWPLSLAVAYAGEGHTTPPAAVVNVRVSVQKTWAEVIASCVEVHRTLQIPREKGKKYVDIWPNDAPISQAAVASIKSIHLADYRMHVQSVMKDELLHYRIDTTNVLDAIENSFLVGGETVVLEKRQQAETVTSPTASTLSPKKARPGKPSPVCFDDAEDGWMLANVKGPDMWENIEVCDVIDAEIPTGNPPKLQWIGCVVTEVRHGKIFKVAPVEGDSGAVTVHKVNRSNVAPFRTKSVPLQQGSSTGKATFLTTAHCQAVIEASKQSKALASVYSSMQLQALGSPNIASFPLPRRRTYDMRVMATRRRSTVSTTTSVDGCCGLINLGNTCFMSSILQCLNSLPGLSQFFLSEEFKADVNTQNPLGLGGRLATEYYRLLGDIWGGTKDDIVNPLRFKTTLTKFAPQFGDHQQHDCQEFLSFLLDGLHEDLNRVIVKPYTEYPDNDESQPDTYLAQQSWYRHLLRNQSVIVDLFQGQMKSVVMCSNITCGKRSLTFDPFMTLSLSLPEDTHTTVAVTLVPQAVAGVLDSGLPRVCRLRVPKACKLREVLAVAAKESGIPATSIIIADVYKNKIYKTISESKRITSVRDTDTVVLHEINPEAPILVEVDQFYIKVAPTTGTTTSTRRGSSRAGCGVPFVLSLTERSTNLDVYNAIQAQLSQWIDALDHIEANKQTLPSTSSTNTAIIVEPVPSARDKRVSTEPSSSGQFFPKHYRVFVLHSKNGGCLLCSKGQSCSGCQLPPTSDTIRTPAENTMICVEWSTEAWSQIRNRVLVPPPFIDSTGYEGESAVKLTDLLGHFSKEEKLDGENAWHCPKCKGAQAATKTISLWATPDVLVIHLKRFSYTATFREKIHRRVDFPIQGLDLSPWTMTSGPPTCEDGEFAASNTSHRNFATLESKDDEGIDDVDSNPTMPASTTTQSLSSLTIAAKGIKAPQLYDLFAVSNHIGSLNGGHYTTVAKSARNGNWYMYDDERVRPVAPAAINGSDAYVLFYQRRVPLTPRASGARRV